MNKTRTGLSRTTRRSAVAQAAMALSGQAVKLVVMLMVALVMWSTLFVVGSHVWPLRRRELERGQDDVEVANLSGDPGNWRQRSQSTSGRLRLKQLALDMALNELHILESLDGELREFVTDEQERLKSEPSSSVVQRQELCALELHFDHSRKWAGCLSDWQLRRQIPPYMLNLHHRLLSECRSLEEAVRMMPYQSLVARSFRQPNLDGDDHLGELNVVVELSALEHHHQGHDGGHRQPPARHSAFVPRTQSPATDTPPSTTACELSHRLRPASGRAKLCYWFPISEQIRAKINGSLAGPPRERLVEGELHLFKLPPELSESPANRFNGSRWSPHSATAHKPAIWTLKTRRRAQTTDTDNSSKSGNNFYHLKTNLLEVSLYQILPKKTANSSEANSELDQEFPLRLLDIRRLDLDSTGWETFYVKRALEDWLQEPSSNLGLVIKAKSMFDEPIKIGLIRFADLYDHRDQHNRFISELSPRTQVTRLQDKMHSERQFDLNHQPILVLYTTTLDH